ncbi:MAG: nucleotidyltransferase domain-containing protein, partial [Hyphomicrobiales bacterium]|nr:nucleotidyltransferase domain-containing protein [Hyphomicrobiales bacterium]
MRRRVAARSGRLFEHGDDVSVPNSRIVTKNLLAFRVCELRLKTVILSPIAPIDDPVLTRFRTALAAAYGERIERVVLFGSRARGDARPDSDYDVAVFLKDFEGIGEEMGPIAEIETDILLDTGMVINALP